MRVKRAKHLGFCSGVRLANIKVKRFAATGEKGAILGQVVHNERVVEEMEKLGVKTVDSLDEVGTPVVVFSAHGVPPSYHAKAKTLGLEVLDTTCKFVYDIHREALAAIEKGAHLVFIGEANHREVIGYTKDLNSECYHIIQTLREAKRVDWSIYSSIKILYQTTLNTNQYEDVVGHIENTNPSVNRADTICHATRQNQEAAHTLAADPEVESVVLIGGKHSANTRHLYEICSRLKPSYLVQGVGDLKPSWFENVGCVGITAGASTPDYVVDEVEAVLSQL